MLRGGPASITDVVQRTPARTNQSTACKGALTASSALPALQPFSKSPAPVVRLQTHCHTRTLGYNPDAGLSGRAPVVRLQKVPLALHSS